MAASGELQPADLVWRQGFPQWQPAGSVDGLFGAAPGASAAGRASPGAPAAVLAGAGFGVRFVARALDVFFATAVGGVGGVVGGIAVAVLMAAGRLPGDWRTRLHGSLLANFLIGAPVTICYHALCEGLHGATIGKLLCGLRVAREDGGACGLKGAFIRNLAFYFDGLFFGLIGYHAMSRSPSRQRYGDKWARTIVVGAESLPAESRRTGGVFLIALLLAATAGVVLSVVGVMLRVLL